MPNSISALMLLQVKATSPVARVRLDGEGKGNKT